MAWFADACIIVLPMVIMLHFIFLFVDHNSKFQKGKLKKSLEGIYCHLKERNENAHDGIRFHELKVIYKNREFLIGVIKKEHSYHYTTYSIFINGDEAGQLHRIGDCCYNQYYFETQNHREQVEVMDIINAGAKEVKRLAKTTTEKKSSWNEHSYFK